MPQDDVSLQFETEDGEGLVHGLFVRAAVDLLAELRQGAERNAVAPLQGQRVAVIGAYAQNGEHAGRAARRRAQPEYVVVAPLYVDIRVLHQHIHDPRGLGASVEDVAHDVEPVYREAFYELGQGGDDVVR